MTDKSNEVYRIVLDNPGIDTPLVCLQMNSNDIVDPEDRGASLALFLMTWHKDAWNETCDLVDQLLSEGRVSFSDDGELHATGM